MTSSSTSISPPSASYPPTGGGGGGGDVPYSLRFRNSPFHRHIPEYSGKLPKGRRLIGDHIYCIDTNARLPGEEQPQLEPMRAFKYVSDLDTGLVLGRQIAVNKPYICYRFGPKFEHIRVYRINTGLASVLYGLAQRVTDMAFFAEDVHLLASASCNGRVYIWKITEGQDENGKPQITSQIVIAIQIVGEGESFHPRVCWHCHKQEILVVGIGERVLKIDTTKVGEGEVFSAIKPLSCPVDNLVEGVKLVGTHDGEVTDLSMSQGLTTFLVSASVDGTIKVWEDHKLIPIAVLRPHAGEPVNSVTFLAAPNNPDHIILITGGPLNREVKIWHSASEKGWLVPSDAESWHCTQTLELKTAETQVGEAFFNQVVAFSQAGLLLLANAKKNAIYAVHLEYGPNPAATRMDYIAEFAVSMPILSFIGKIGLLPNGEQIVLVYSVDTEDFQQYALDLSQCLPPASDNAVFERAESSASRDANIEGFSQRLPTEVTTSQESDTYSIEKAAQSIVDALWLCLQDESAKQEKVLRDQVSYMMGCIREESAKLENVLRNLLREESAKQEKLLRDHIQQVTNMISSSLKKEVSDIGPTAVEAVTRAESSTISRHRAESSTISRHRA